MSSQRRIWILHQFTDQQAVYNIQKTLEFDGQLDVNRLEQSILVVIKKHEILRTAIVTVDDMPKQKILPVTEICFKIEVCPDLDALGKSEHLLALNHELSNFIFDLSTPPFIKIIAVPEGKRWFILFLGHHMVFDARSIDILFEEVMHNYERLSHQSLPENRQTDCLPLQYKDFAEWEKKIVHDESSKTSRTYWREKLSGDLPVVKLPCDFERPLKKTYNGDAIYFSLTTEETSAVRAASKATEGTNFVVLLTIFKILLHKYSGDSDIVIGTPVSNRNHKDLENLIGVFINTLVLRSFLNKNLTFMEQLVQVKAVVLEAFEHRNYPFEELLNELQLNRDISRSPVFDVLFSYLQRDLSIDNSNKTGLKVKGMEREVELTKYDLAITFTELENTIAVCLEYNTDLFKKKTIETLAVHFRKVMRTMLFSHSIRIKELQLLNDQEVASILAHKFKRQIYTTTGVIALFEEQVRKTPDNLALVFENVSYTYVELNRKVNSLANYLMKKASKGNCIGVLLDRSGYAVISILAIIKAGCTYVPIDPLLPKKRLDFIISDASINVILTDSKYAPDLSVMHTLVVEEEERWNNYSTDNVAVPVGFNDSIYVIYTSGTTGVPKGVVNRHISVLNLSLWLKTEIYDAFEVPARALLNAELVFDASVQQIFAPLISGASIHIIKNVLRKNPCKLFDFLAQKQINVWDVTPSFLSLFLSENEESSPVKSLRYTLVGGEPLSRKTADEYLRLFPQSKLINVYGVTEASVDSAYSIVNEQDDPALISSPLPNTRLHVLDKDMAIVPDNCIGELYISGDGVSKGYLNSPELTRQSFLPSPFFKGEILFNTKDLCKRLPDKRLKFLGRSDDQIKIRGYRIQISEITTVLLTHPAIKDAKVIKWTSDKNEDYLLAYYVCLNKLDENEIRTFLSTGLSDYMLPDLFIHVDRIPLTTSGKIDISALPLPDFSSSDQQLLRTPTTFMEQSICKIWEVILDKPKIGIHDNFFSLGGHSIKAIQILSRINEQFNVEIELSSVFLNPTVFSLSKHIENYGNFAYNE
jgi:amino acid adenylation domain-containing protein